MATPLLPEGFPGIDADPVNFFGWGQGSVGFEI